ncbi:MAG: DNA polymerase III subunit gamma/tau [Legionellales bacterium]|nr:DNA polymerase III subunit gamma/tau [Legionellales bacterium]
MSHQVLARKWRPKQFNEVMGQSHIVDALTHALNTQRLHHAYLFTGTRGVGKTSLARLLAKAVNCEQGITTTPCEQCTSCIEISQGRFVDLIEVDAASRTKVEDTRELLDNVQYAPTRGRYKVYLIDEVHMLSGHSFNALLKTLEEPPSHVMFLLATTDPQKLPVTVLSRCLQFHLKNMPEMLINQHLASILSQEKIAFESEALPYIAQAAKGSMRDALSLLDQAISHGQGNVILDKVLAMLGCIDQQHTIALIQALAANSPEKLFEICQKIAELAADYQQVISDILHILTEIALLQTLPSATLRDETQRGVLLQLGECINKETVQLYYQIALLGNKDIAYAPSANTGFMMLMLRMLNFTPQSKSTQPSNVILKTTDQTSKNRASKLSAEKLGKIIQNPPKQQKPAVETLSPVAQDWETIINQIQLSGPLKILATHCIAKEITDSSIHLILETSQAPLLTERNKMRLNEALTTYFNKSLSLKIDITADEIASPATLLKQKIQLKNEQAHKNIEKDQNVQSILKEFNATIDINAIKAKE